jgi:glycosyltransferase involved in cell wall biosynthesis
MIFLAFLCKGSKEMKAQPTQITNKSIVSVFVPYWGRGNPYQDTLAVHLVEHGISVDKDDFLKKIFRRIVFHHYKPNILHLHWLSPFGGTTISLLKMMAFVMRLFILWTLGLRIVWTVHNLIPHEAKYPKIDLLVRKLIAKLAHAIIAHSEAAKKKIVSAWRLKKIDRIFVIPHGNYINQYENNIDQTTARAKLNICDSKVVMLFLGGIRPYKGVLELIKAFKLLEQEKAYLVIAGNPLNNRLSSAIKEQIKGVENIQYKPGFVPTDQIQVYMNACDVVVFPYHKILSSGAVVLAMSFGRACIAPRWDCICDILDSSGAFLYEPGNVESLVQAMHSTVERRAQLKEMGEYNKLQAQQWDWDTIACKTKEVYKKCLS